MSKNSPPRISFYQNKIRAYLGSSVAGCDLNLVQPQESACQSYLVEILLQPTDKCGIPRGRIRCLYKTLINLSTNHCSGYTSGGERLPFRLPQEILFRCYLRLTEHKMINP